MKDNTLGRSCAALLPNAFRTLPSMYPNLKTLILGSIILMGGAFLVTVLFYRQLGPRAMWIPDHWKWLGLIDTLIALYPFQLILGFLSTTRGCARDVVKHWLKMEAMTGVDLTANWGKLMKDPNGIRYLTIFGSFVHKTIPSINLKGLGRAVTISIGIRDIINTICILAICVGLIVVGYVLGVNAFRTISTLEMERVISIILALAKYPFFGWLLIWIVHNIMGTEIFPDVKLYTGKIRDRMYQHYEKHQAMLSEISNDFRI